MNDIFVKESDLSDLTPEQAELFTRFEQLGIETKTWDHNPVFSTAESDHLYEVIPGAHCKTLFLTDAKKSGYWLAVALDQTRADLKNLHHVLGCKRMSFGRAETMQAMIGVTPGSVTPFALMHDTEQEIKVLLDTAILPFDTVNFHPLKNDKTTSMKREDLFRFIESCGHDVRIVNLENPRE